MPIRLDIKPYCVDCPHFEADVKKNTYKFNQNGYWEDYAYMTDIYCKHKDRCESMLKYLAETERDKKDD